MSTIEGTTSYTAFRREGIDALVSSGWTLFVGSARLKVERPSLRRGGEGRGSAGQVEKIGTGRGDRVGEG